jgi:predicted short-subunit dehydrogenase-like oxidoreductase (DUF2520 family)
MKIVFIGAGNLATHLAKALFDNGHQIVQIYSRTEVSAQSLALETSAEATTDLSLVNQGADLYLFSVKDDILESLLMQMPQTNGIWAHTAGSVPIEVFKKHHNHYGVIYPFQTFSKLRPVDFSQIPVFVEANDEQTFSGIESCMSGITRKIFRLSSDKRKYLHLSGVFACNFVNHLYAISEKILQTQNIPFEVILPLIDETARKVHEIPPHNAQTGPAIRYDQNVIEKHLALLVEEDQKTIYELLSTNIHQNNK